MGKMAKKTKLTGGVSKIVSKNTSPIKNSNEGAIGKRKNNKNKRQNVKATIDDKPPKTVNKAIKQNGKPFQNNKREQKAKPKGLNKTGKSEVSEKSTTKNENGTETVEIKLNKRVKNRAKAIIKSEILQKKTVVALSDPNILNKKLEKLKTKSEAAPSMKRRRKILVLEKLIENAKQKTTNKQKTATANKQKIKKKDETSKSLNDTAENSSSGKQNIKQSNAQISKSVMYEVFVGGLPKMTKANELVNHFSEIGGIVKVDMKRGKGKRSANYAFVHCKDEQTRQKMLAMHGTKFNEKTMKIFYGGKHESKQDINKLNSELLAKRATNTLTEQQTKTIGTQLQKRNNKNAVGEQLQKNKNKNKNKKTITRKSKPDDE